jgi:hypothetical protein
MNPNSEIERFFKDLSNKDRKRVESCSEYQFALKSGNTTAALEIASVMVINQRRWRETQEDLTRVFLKHFPEKSN